MRPIASPPRLALALAAGCASPPAAPDLCEDAGAATASFRVDLGDWPIDGNLIVLDRTCEVTGARTLTCPDDQAVLRPIGLEWSAEPALGVAWQVGDTVEFRLRRYPSQPDTTGAFAVRTPAGALLLAGNTADSSDFGVNDLFAPFAFSVDFDTCEDREPSDCIEERPLILEFDDGAAGTRVAGGRSAELAAGLAIVVERALRHVSHGPKLCPVIDTPPAYQFLIGAPASAG